MLRRGSANSQYESRLAVVTRSEHRVGSGSDFSSKYQRAEPARHSLSTSRIDRQNPRQSGAPLGMGQVVRTGHAPESTLGLEPSPDQAEREVDYLRYRPFLAAEAQVFRP
jgi:hypothetical protein